MGYFVARVTGHDKDFTKVEGFLRMEFPNYIALAIPLFFILIAVEWVLSYWKRQESYRLNDAVNDLSLGSYSEIIGAFLKTIVFTGYLFIYEYASIFTIQFEWWWAWVLCFLFYDMQYYWAHRMSHTMNFLWATHIPHHQSEDFNLAVALRQGAFQGSFFWVFYLPLALVGFPPAMFIACAQLDTIYQFFIHTRGVGKLGPLEWVMNTPSHHRVHHGQNPKYIDKNHAGVFIIWDRMFGSFQEEEEEPVYGIVTPLRSWNPLWGTVHYWVQLGKTAKAAPHLSDKVKLWFMPPAWQPRGMPERPPRDEVAADTFKKFNPVLPAGLNSYIFVQFVVVLGASVAFLEMESTMSWLVKALFAAYLLFGLACIGGMFEAKRWVLSTELLRVVGTAVLFVALSMTGYGIGGNQHWILSALMVAFAAVSVPWLWRHRAVFRYDFGPLPDEAAYPDNGEHAAPAPVVDEAAVPEVEHP